MNSSFFESTELDRRDRRRLRRCRGGSPFGRWSSLGGSELFGRWFSFPDCAAAGVAVESWFMASLMSGLGAIASGLMVTCRTCSKRWRRRRVAAGTVVWGVSVFPLAPVVFWRDGSDGWRRRVFKGRS